MPVIFVCCRYCNDFLICSRMVSDACAAVPCSSDCQCTLVRSVFDGFMYQLAFPVTSPTATDDFRTLVCCVYDRICKVITVTHTVVSQSLLSHHLNLSQPSNTHAVV